MTRMACLRSRYWLLLTKRLSSCWWDAADMMTGLYESLSVPWISTTSTSVDRGRFFLMVVALRNFGWGCGVMGIVGAGLP